MTRLAMPEGDNRSLRIPAQDVVCKLFRAAERWPAQSDLDAIGEATHALSCDLLRAGQRRLGPGGPGHGRGDRMMAGEREPTGQIEDGLRNARRVRDIE